MFNQFQEGGSKPGSATAERREDLRLGVQVRVSVLGVDATTTIHNELTETMDISASGLRLTLSYPVRVGDHISINADAAQLRAKMAIFEVRWIQPHGSRRMVGAHLVSKPDTWLIA